MGFACSKSAKPEILFHRFFLSINSHHIFLFSFQMIAQTEHVSVFFFYFFYHYNFIAFVITHVNKNVNVSVTDSHRSIYVRRANAFWNTQQQQQKNYFCVFFFSLHVSVHFAFRDRYRIGFGDGTDFRSSTYAIPSRSFFFLFSSLETMPRWID